MRYERLIIEAGANTFTLDLHPRLTVVAGLGRLEREALTGELIDALSRNRAGVHVELSEDGGRRLAVFRPYGARSRIVDVDRAEEVTDEFVDGKGSINLLHGTGLEPSQARRKLRFASADLAAATQGSQLIRSLAAADQGHLWATVDSVLDTERILHEEAAELGSAPEDAEIMERVEARHRSFETLQARHERSRRFALAIAALATLGTLPVWFLVSQTLALPVVTLGIVAMLCSVITRSRMERARRKETAALAEVGAQSYLGFHLQRVNGMLSSEAARKRLLEAASRNREAVSAWVALAGDIPVSWALDHHEEITAAARVRIDITTHATMSALPHELDDDTTTDLARVLVGRLAELRRLGGGSESYPLLLDDPFAGLDRSAKPALLELLTHTSGSPQLVYLTEDEDVASWARLEALTGALSIIEPAAERAGDARHRLTAGGAETR